MKHLFPLQNHNKKLKIFCVHLNIDKTHIVTNIYKLLTYKNRLFNDTLVQLYKMGDTYKVNHFQRKYVEPQSFE